MSGLVYNEIKIYGNNDNLVKFINELVMEDQGVSGSGPDRIITYNFYKQFDELRKVSSDDKDINEIKSWDNNFDMMECTKAIGHPIQIHSDHIIIELTDYAPLEKICCILVKKYTKLKIYNESVMSLSDYPYNWMGYFEGENGQYTRIEYRDSDRIYWKDGLEIIFEYKEDVLNKSYTLTSLNVYNKVKKQFNKYNEVVYADKQYDVIPWTSDLSIMIEHFWEGLTDSISISKGKIYDNKEISETNVKELIEFIYNDESFSRM